MICISMGYPDIHSEIEIVKGSQKGNPADAVQPAAGREMLLECGRRLSRSMCMMQFMNIWEGWWRRRERIRWFGLESVPGERSPLAKAAKAYAYLEERTFCIPQDVAEVFPNVAVHRLF